MNNDTPQIFGEDAHDYPPDAGSFPEHDGEAFPAFHGWAGWGDRVEPVAPDDDYPQPSLSPYEPSYQPSTSTPPTRRSFRSGPARGNRVTRRVPAMRPIRAMRGAWGIRRTRETTVTWATRLT